MLHPSRRIFVKVILKLSGFSFITNVDRCYPANINEVEKYVKDESGYLVMNAGTTIDVNKKQKESPDEEIVTLRRLI